MKNNNKAGRWVAGLAKELSILAPFIPRVEVTRKSSARKPQDRITICFGGQPLPEYRYC